MRATTSEFHLEDLRLFENYPLFARTCLKIVDKEGYLGPLRLTYSQTKVQAAIDRRRRDGIPPRIVVLKSRQTGHSTDAEGRLIHRAWARPNRQGIVVAHKRESAQKIFEISRRFYENLPAALKMPKLTYDTKNQIRLPNGSSIQIEVATKGAGRGFTAPDIHLSEAALYPDPEALFTAILASQPDTTDSLLIVESTAFGMNAFHDLWIAAKTGQSDFVPIFVPWHDEPTYRRAATFRIEQLDEYERATMEKHALSLEQMAWYRWALRNKCGGDKNRRKQEFPNDDREAFLSTGRPLFDSDSVSFYAIGVPPYVTEDKLGRKVCDIEWESEKPKIVEWGGGPLSIYEMPMERHQYIVGVDPSEGDPGSDPSPCVVMDRMSLEPVAVWYGRKRPDRLAHVTRALCVLYNKAKAAWEANNHGLAFQIEFEKLYDDFYMREVSADSVAKKKTDKPGYMTTVKSRHFLFDTLRVCIDDRRARIRDPILIGQLGSMIYDEKNQPQAQPGKEKDVLVAYALCLECHRDGEDELAPLSLDERRDIVGEIRRAQVARSMGHDVQIRLNRYGLTAEELEKLDELEYKAEQRRERLRLGEPA